MSDIEITCNQCGGPTRMQVQAIISAPGRLVHKLSKQNLRQKEVYLMGVEWETADFICENPKCCHVTGGYGNYVSDLKKERDALAEQVATLRTQNGLLRERLVRVCHQA